MEKLVLIDGNSLINRAFYAMPPLTTKDGVYTNAVYGFMNMFFKMVAEEKPTAIACAFDLKAPTFRHKMYEEYKGTRKPMPEELRPQIPLLKELLALMGVCCIEKEGFEADDIIGTIAKNTDVQTVIITGDKDSFQLVDEQTEIHFTKRGITDTEIYNSQNFTEKTGITPIQIIDLKALMGDSSDNIPGVPGVGEKTAKNLVAEYGSVENLYENIENIGGKLQEKLINGKELCFLSKTLATINTDCGVLTDVSKMAFTLPLSSIVKQKFVELEFRTLSKKEEYFEKGNIETAPQKEPKINLPPVEIVSLTECGQIKDLNPTENTAIAITEECVSVYFSGKEYIIPVMKTLFDTGLNLSEILTSLKHIWEGQNTLILFDKKQIKHTLKDIAGITLSAPCEDVALMKYLADYGTGNETFNEVLEIYNKNAQTPARSLYEIYLELGEKITEHGVEELYRKTELPLSDVLFDMEEAGFKVDYDALCLTGENFREFLDKTEREIRELAGEDTLNVNSPKQLGDVLFEKLKIGKGKKTKKGYSTSADVLAEFEDSHPIVPLISKYRKIQKLQSTYIDGFKPLIDKKTGLIHTCFNQTITATGRLSSKEPNLQNIPVREDEGKELRKFFVAKGEDRVLITADYSQIELRLLADFSKCQALIDAFNTGHDVHRETASKVFGVKLEEVTPQMRSRAKAVNFGIIYGISEYGLAKNIGSTPREARGYIDAYFKEYPEVKSYMNQNVLFARENGFVSTLFGRRRYIREINASNFPLRSFGERVAMNMPLQGSSADIIKVAMINVHKKLRKENLDAQLILQVHDELIVDCAEKDRGAVEKILTEEMEGAAKLAVELTVGLGCGKTWFDAK